MRSIVLLSILLAVSNCTDRHADDGSRYGVSKSESERSTVKVPPIDPEELERRVEATRMAYAVNKDRADRIFGETFEDIWWQRPTARKMKRISTGDVFKYAAYNGGYSSYFGLFHGGQLLQGDVKALAVDEHRFEPIYVVGPALVQTGALRGTIRSWTDEELHLIASFIQTSSQIMRVDDIASLRANGHHKMADAKARLPTQKVSVVVDNQ